MNNVGERANTIYRRSGSSAEPSSLPAAEKIERADSRLALLLTETRRAAAKALKKRVREERRVCDGVGGGRKRRIDERQDMAAANSTAGGEKYVSSVATVIRRSASE